jgi:putative flippase GtrA
VVPSDRSVPIVPDLRTRMSALAQELGKFGAVGAVAYVVDVGLFNLLRFGVDLGPLTSKTLSTLVAVTVAYVGNRYWTWRDRRQHGVRREYTMFALVNGGGLAIQLACLGFTVYVLGLDGHLAENIAGNVVGVVLGTVFRFWAYRTWVFPQLPAPEQTDVALERTTTTPY